MIDAECLLFSGCDDTRLLSLCKKLNNYVFRPGCSQEVRLVCDGAHVGLLSRQFSTTLLASFPSVFCSAGSDAVTFTEALTSSESRSRAVHQMLVKLRDLEDSDQFYPQLRGWRSECYEIRQSLAQPALFSLERSASPLFGVRKYGVQINGHVEHSQLGLCLWLQKRSFSLSPTVFVKFSMSHRAYYFPTKLARQLVCITNIQTLETLDKFNVVSTSNNNTNYKHEDHRVNQPGLI